ncbi:cytochrome c [Mesorhizobium sp. M1423]|uniref:c-type cytochrome n=1 Tax=Mesorhizobium sp. M1423 TaxID=2957101 RepID=UPI003336648B
MRYFSAAPAIFFLVGFLVCSGELAQVQNSSAQQFADPERFAQRDGAGIYVAVCQGCHMSWRKGAVGAGQYPALTKNENLETREYPIYVLIHGHQAMPPLGSYLDDDQIAAVVNYIRSNGGNSYSDAVTAEDVALVRQRRAGQKKIMP